MSNAAEKPKRRTQGQGAAAQADAPKAPSGTRYYAIEQALINLAKVTDWLERHMQVKTGKTRKAHAAEGFEIRKALQDATAHAQGCLGLSEPLDQIEITIKDLSPDEIEQLKKAWGWASPIIHTNGGEHADMDSESIDALCEEINR